MVVAIHIAGNMRVYTRQRPAATSTAIQNIRIDEENNEIKEQSFCIQHEIIFVIVMLITIKNMSRHLISSQRHKKLVKFSIIFFQKY